MMLASIDSIPGKEFEVLGMAKGTIVQSKNFGRDFMAGLHRNAQRSPPDCHKAHG